MTPARRRPGDPGRRPADAVAPRLPVAAAAAAAAGLVFLPPGGAAAQGAWQTYQYDTLGRLAGAWDSAGRDARFAHDPADNRTETRVAAGPAPPRPPDPPPAPPAPSAYRVVPVPGGGAAVFPF